MRKGTDYEISPYLYYRSEEVVNVNKRHAVLLSGLMICLVLLTVLGSVSTAAPSGTSLQPFLSAKIDWKQFKGTTLNVLALPHAYTLALEKYVPIFEELTGIKVNYEMLGEQEMRQKLMQDLASGSGLYDVVPVGVIHMEQLTRPGWLAPLDPFIQDTRITDNSWYRLEDIGEGLRDMLTLRGKLYAIPVGPSTPIFWYREDLFKKYGISVPDTWEEIIPMKQKLQAALDADGQKGVYAFTTRAKRGAGENDWITTAMIQGYGAQWLDENFEPAFNRPEAVKAIELYKQLITGYGCPPGSESLSFYEFVEMFAAGHLASMVTGVDHVVFINDPTRSKVADKWNASYIPRGPKGRFTSPWAWALAMSAKARNPKAAWLFMEWASSEPIMKMMGTSISPSRLALWESEPFKALDRPNYIKAAVWSYKEGKIERFRGGLPNYQEASERLSVALSEIFMGAPAQETLDKAAADLKKIIRKP